MSGANIVLLSSFDAKKRFPGVIWPKGAEQTIWVSSQVTIGEGTEIEPNVKLQGNTHIGSNCNLVFGANLIDTECGDECTLGTMIKRSILGNNVAVGHMNSYIGDTTIKDGVNIAAGVVTANYDGREKKKTFIGEDSFIGVGVTLVAQYPQLYIGHRTFIAAGVVIRRDVSDDTYVNPKGGFWPNRMIKVGPHWIRQSK